MSSSKTVLEKVRAYNKKEPFGFTVSPADPCMLFKENNLGICIIIMYVDDMLVIGKRNNTRVCNNDTERICSQDPGDFIKISSSMSPYKSAVSTSMTRLSSFSTIILAKAILNETSCATGAKLSVYSLPGL